MLMKRLMDESAASNHTLGTHFTRQYSSIDNAKAAQIVGTPQ